MSNNQYLLFIMEDKIKKLKEQAQESLELGNSKEKAWAKGVLHAVKVIISDPGDEQTHIHK